MGTLIKHSVSAASLRLPTTTGSVLLTLLPGVSFPPTATDGKDGNKGVSVRIAGGPTIADVAVNSLTSKKISHGEKRHFQGNCDVVCKEVCEEPTITTKCIKVPFEYELCETKPIVRIKEVRDLSSSQVRTVRMKRR